MRAIYMTLALLLPTLVAACPSDSPEPSTDAVTTTDTASDVEGDTATTTDSPAAPDAPPTSDTPSTPDTPATPDVPSNPDVPATPDVPEDPPNCLEHFACVAAACATASAESLQGCVNDAATGCGFATDGSDVEGTLAADLGSCVATSACLLDQSKDMWECLADQCLSESAACQAGTFGEDNSCFDLRSCSNANCSPGITGIPDFDCLRNCAADYTQTAVEAYLDLEYCLEANCVGAPDKKVCFQQVQSNPECSAQVTNCPNL